MHLVNPRRMQTIRRIDPSMNMLSRFFRVIASNINSFIRRMEDPEKIIEQAVLDMQSDLIRVRQSYAEITATLRRMEGQREQMSTNAGEWYCRAQLALAKGDDDLAREALSKRQLQLENVENVTKSLQLQESAVSKLYSSMTGLEKKIFEAKRQKESMIARARTAKTAVNVNDMLSALGDSSSTDAFERMKEKVESLEMQAEIAGELATSTSGTSVNLEKRFQSLEVDDKIEEELKRMRNKNAITTEFMEFQQAPTYIELQPEYDDFDSIGLD
eukprot:CAMPEP_0185003370 /NCGR_PEP_ID=MMETSP1098-20130426/76346_1 /TAXON_ID=89044 /ORGANISM="Spumella elongata, Strain CCAP 955/1" /LENGTH=272 /DNA_ID=CAMNT_0027531023 /DNA_START=97 /DNA_END=913 /DNA_ORIENTATION=-